MKSFEKGYISRYYEEKYYSIEIIKANTEKVALNKFATFFNIENSDKLLDPSFTWQDGLWLASFKCIKEVNEIICPECNGNGKIIIKEISDATK